VNRPKVINQYFFIFFANNQKIRHICGRKGDMGNFQDISISTASILTGGVELLSSASVHG
jgi:hypothetical protein